MAKKNKPAIRFKEFTDAWEQRKLGEVVERITRKNENLESTLPLTISAQYGLINQNEFFDKRIASKDVSGYFLVRNGEFAYNKSTSSDAPWGAIKRLDRYESGVLSTLYIVFKISDERKTSSDYIVTYYNTDLWHKGIQAIAAEGARNHGLLNVAPADFFETNLTMPKDYAEQQQIGSFFQQLDHLITLHQRKYDKLQVLKKAMLEKMFPKNGSSVPEIRFKGFTDAWEQRKLGEVVERITRKNENLESTLPLTISAQYGLINQNEFFDKRIASKDVSGYFLVRNGEFAYNKSTSSDAPWGAIKRLDRYESGVLSTLYIVFKISDERKTSSDYIVTYYNTDLWHKGIQAIAAEGARNHGLLNVAPADFFETNLTMPKDYAEQQQIGSFFQQLDHLITLHQRKYDKLQVLKKAMLEKMFPKNGSSVPEIRFKGFTDAWEQRKLGALCVEFKSGDFISASDIAENEAYPVYGGNGLRGFTNHYNHDGEYALIGRQGALCGNVNYAVGKSYFTEHAVAVRANKTNQTRFLYYLFSTMNLGQYSGQSAQPGLAVGNLVELENVVPSKPEQEKIASFLSSLDNLITLHQRELEKLQNIKKSMLEKMFV